jgi:HlyD family secretion protein
MKLSITPAQSQQARQRLANPQESLSYELGKAVQELPRSTRGCLRYQLLVFGAIAWAHFSRIDEVAVANGKTFLRLKSSCSCPERWTIVQTKVKAGDQLSRRSAVEIDPGATELTSKAWRRKQRKSAIAWLDWRQKAEETGNAECRKQPTERCPPARV